MTAPEPPRRWRRSRACWRRTARLPPPSKGGWGGIPAAPHRLQPSHDLRGALGVLSRQRATHQNPRHGLGHVGGSSRNGQKNSGMAARDLLFAPAGLPPTGSLQINSFETPIGQVSGLGRNRCQTGPAPKAHLCTGGAQWVTAGSQTASKSKKKVGNHRRNRCEGKLERVKRQ